MSNFEEKVNRLKRIRQLKDKATKDYIFFRLDEIIDCLNKEDRKEYDELIEMNGK